MTVLSSSGRLAAVVVASVALVACASGESVVGAPDAARDAGVTRDVPAIDAVDVTRPDVPALDTPDVPARCTGDNDCARSASGGVCDTASGRCVRCTSTRDTCPGSQHCDLNTCVDGCHTDEGCAVRADAGVDGGVAGGVCDVANHRCVACVRDEHCPAGTLCMSNRCVPGCSEARACPSGLSCCGGGCVDLQTSADTCGACGTRCVVTNGAAGCTAGRCTVSSCGDGFADCNAEASDGCETDTRMSATNCGAGGRACRFANAAASCSAGACVMGACEAGFADCNGDASDGCEVDTRTSTAHCGACGRGCTFANASGSCAMSTCAMGACATGFADCDGNPANGCEVAPASDVNHCGGCGRACSVARATATCAAGACRVGTCDAGFADCDNDPANGCETPTTANAANCGACGRACAGGANATGVCVAGVCGITCAAGFSDCDGNAANGCETATLTSVANCGACGRTCAAATNATPTCAAGTCGIACAAGFGNCDGNAANGCETATVTNASNCGVCGITCLSGFTCIAGRCESVSCPPPATCTGTGCPTTCARVLFSEDWEAGTSRWHLPRGGAQPINTITDGSACAGRFLRETERYSAGRVFTRASIAVTPGRTYCVSAWIRGSAGTWPFIGMRNSDMTGALGSENWLIGQPCFGTGIASQPVSPVTSDAAWRWYGRQFVMPSAYNYIVLEIEIWDGGAVGTADFDQVQFLEGPCPATPPTVCAPATCGSVTSS
ncbi:MAG: hypothetical protein U0325_20555 [Polyangiales bacterium]